MICFPDAVCRTQDELMQGIAVSSIIFNKQKIGHDGLANALFLIDRDDR
ncbi:MAG: hypothetical protein ACLVJ6_15935 [Merdibacter sp.]